MCVVLLFLCVLLASSSKHTCSESEMRVVVDEEIERCAANRRMKEWNLKNRERDDDVMLCCFVSNQKKQQIHHKFHSVVFGTRQMVMRSVNERRIQYLHIYAYTQNRHRSSCIRSSKLFPIFVCTLARARQRWCAGGGCMWTLEWRRWIQSTNTFTHDWVAKQE